MHLVVNALLGLRRTRRKMREVGLNRLTKGKKIIYLNKKKIIYL